MFTTDSSRFDRHGRRQNRSALFAWVTLICGVVLFFPSPVQADEVVLEEANDGLLIRTGDFELKTCREPVITGLSLLEGLGSKSGEITAGELYRFFKSQGKDSVDRLVLCVDLEGNPLRTDVGFDDFVLTIEDPFETGQPTRSFSLDRDGDNSLVVPGYETSMLKPEAQLEIPLGYDFMQRYSENSEEIVKLDFQYSDDNEQSNVPLAVYFPAEQTIRWFSIPRLSLVFVFAVFWVVVFWALIKFTLPKPQTA